MILQSRKWRLVIRMLALLVTSGLMLAFAGPVSYALKDDTPKPVSSLVQLLDETGQPRLGDFVNARAVPDIDRAFVTREGSDTYYWIPLRGFGGRVLVRTEDPRYVLGRDTLVARDIAIPTHYAGKVASLTDQVEVESLAAEISKRGLSADEETAIVLLQGEAPSEYRPMVPVMPVLAWVWGAALLGMLQIWRGRRPRRRMAY